MQVPGGGCGPSGAAGRLGVGLGWGGLLLRVDHRAEPLSCTCCRTELHVFSGEAAGKILVCFQPVSGRPQSSSFPSGLRH